MAKNCSLDFELSQWTVAYPFSDGEGEGEAVFSSDHPMLDAIWALCRDSLRYTSLDTFTDSNVRERMPYEADGFCAAQSFWALRQDRSLVAHSTQYLLNNPTWPTEWKQYAVMLVHGHYMQTGDSSLASRNFGQLWNNTMLPFIDRAHSELVNFTSTLIPTQGCPLPPTGVICNSPICHNDTEMYPPGHATQFGGRSCDNIDWLPKFRAGFTFTPVNTVINAFAVHTMQLLAELAVAIGRPEDGAELAAQARRTKEAMLRRMYMVDSGMWCDGICSDVQPACPTCALNATSFHSQHYALSLGITPDGPGVAKALQYQLRARTVCSTSTAVGLGLPPRLRCGLHDGLLLGCRRRRRRRRRVCAVVAQVPAGAGARGLCVLGTLGAAGAVPPPPHNLPQSELLD
jgi:hypothetical protein